MWVHLVISLYFHALCLVSAIIILSKYIPTYANFIVNGKHFLLFSICKFKLIYLHIKLNYSTTFYVLLVSHFLITFCSSTAYELGMSLLESLTP